MPADFVDTNVIIYLLEKDAARAARAEKLIAAGAIVSVQVLNEIVSTGRRKAPERWEELGAFLDRLRPLLTIVPLTVDTHRLAVDLIGRYGFAPYDSAIVASALLAGCETLWSEDMQDGLIVERQLTIRNPFSPGSPARRWPGRRARR